MNVTATTRLTAEQCMDRLAACPALPRGERLQWATPSSNLWNRAMRHRASGRGSLLRPVLWTFPITAGSTVSQEALDVCWARWRTLAAPVRRLRDERRALKAELRQASALLVFERADRLADMAKFIGIWATHLNPQPRTQTPEPEDCQHGQDPLTCYDCGEP